MTETNVVELDHITHRYGPTVALQGCGLEIAPGEIHGLVGENGSGKSTVVKLLSGIMLPTAGRVLVDGRQVDLRSPSHAQRHGIVTVFQETLVADECTGIDNVFGGGDGLLRRARTAKAERKAAEEVLEALGADSMILGASPYQLSLADRQVLTLTRALVRPWRVLILDEATSALDLATRDRLFELLIAAREQGRSVLFVSHRMDELAILIDRATVQRSGRTVGTVSREEATPSRLLSMMSDRDVETAVAATRHVADRARDGAPILRARDLAGGKAAPGYELAVRQGEILGVAALDGQGGGGLVELLAGRTPPARGRLELRRDQQWRRVSGYRDAARAGIAYVPGKRQEEGLFRTLPVRDNLAMATFGRHSRLGFFRSGSVLETVIAEMRKLGVVPNDPTYPITGLSGGNAQKVLIGRWLATRPDVLVLNDPLRGVDIGTKQDFYQLLRELTADGMTVVMLSTEIEELLVSCDRVAVCHAHRVHRVLEGDEFTYDGVLAAMFGRDPEPAATTTPEEVTL
ncbi:sugar ABC transporter ATP-binding protein [Dactylosporangium sp. CA-233914]|uniref:sugar ABC transporter ATP-binding protein n=1 Tax=Dactylosporangium sp. CA-233914 TaxID=3239934 RepID=UPI003D8B15A7